MMVFLVDSFTVTFEFARTAVKATIGNDVGCGLAKLG